MFINAIILVEIVLKERWKPFRRVKNKWINRLFNRVINRFINNGTGHPPTPEKHPETGADILSGTLPFRPVVCRLWSCKVRYKCNHTSRPGKRRVLFFRPLRFSRRRCCILPSRQRKGGWKEQLQIFFRCPEENWTKTIFSYILTVKKGTISWSQSLPAGYI